MPATRTALLVDHPEALEVLEGWFESEWPDWYGAGGPGNARDDLRAYSRRGALPLAVVAFAGDELVGVMALTAHSISGRPDLGPWAAAGLVAPAHRGRGHGGELLRAVERIAAELGFERLYSGTATARSLLERNGWSHIGDADAHGHTVAVYEKRLASR